MYVACSKCDKTIALEEAHRYQKKKGEEEYFCPDCKQLMEREFQQETEDPNYIGAVVGGIGGGVIGGALWFFVETLLNIRFGYIALAVGFLVGTGVILGSGKKRGEKLQIISAVISLVAVIGASYLSTVHQINDYLGKTGVSLDSLAVSPFDTRILESMVSGPMSLIIWAFAVYFGYRTPKARKL